MRTTSAGRLRFKLITKPAFPLVEEISQKGSTVVKNGKCVCGDVV
jgi:hypothetical protein